MLKNTPTKKQGQKFQFTFGSTYNQEKSKLSILFKIKQLNSKNRSYDFLFFCCNFFLIVKYRSIPAK